MQGSRSQFGSVVWTEFRDCSPTGSGLGEFFLCYFRSEARQLSHSSRLPVGPSLCSGALLPITLSWQFAIILLVCVGSALSAHEDVSGDLVHLLSC